MGKTYSEMHDEEISEKYRELRRKLPKFLNDYFMNIDSLLPSTKFGYATDLYIFFEWIKDAVSDYSASDLTDIPFDALKSLTHDDINSFITEYLDKYEKEGKILLNGNIGKTQVITNGKTGKARKLTTIKSLYKYYSALGKIDYDPTIAISVHNPSEEHIIYLRPNEMAKLLDCIESDNPLFNSQRKEYEKYSSEKLSQTEKRMRTLHQTNKARDLAIFTLLLATGVRISECVGLNLSDVDFDEAELHVMRKGHRKDSVFMCEELQEALRAYLTIREAAYHPDRGEEALFLARGGSRLGVRQIEKMLKAYIAAALPGRKDEKISPHKLRSTFAMQYYNGEREDGEEPDALLLSSLLGHKNLATVQKYAKASDAKKRTAFMGVKLRKL